MKLEILYLLEEVLLERRRLPSPNSYSSYLFSRGLPKILDKLGEETVELVVASCYRTKQDVIDEAADVVFHLLVFMVFMRIRIDDMLPGGGRFSGTQIEEALGEQDSKENFFYAGAMDSVARLVILSGDYDESREKYDKISNKCRQLFYCVLLLCNSRQVRMRRILEELRNRLTTSRPEDKDLTVTH